MKPIKYFTTKKYNDENFKKGLAWPMWLSG